MLSPILVCVGPLPVFTWIAVLTLALVFGSFLNVCISRLPEHRSIVRPRSHCPECQAPIRSRDNVPVLSWLLLRGRCRDCGRPISWRYPLIELGYTALAAACVLRFGATIESAVCSIFCFFVLGLLVMDFETMLLPDAFTLTGLGLGMVAAFALSMMREGDLSDNPTALTGAVSGFVSAALAASTWALLLLIIRWSYYAVRRRHGLGLGDVKLAAMLAAWLGNEAMALCFLLAVLGATLVGFSAISGRALVKRRPAGDLATQAGWGSLRLPLGFFLCASGILCFFLGGQIVSWYLHLFS